MARDDDHLVNEPSAEEWWVLEERLRQSVRDIDAYERRCNDEGVVAEPALLKIRDSFRTLLGSNGQT